jgi:uncharacterized protein YcfJ
MNNTVLAGIIVGGVVLAAAGSILASSGYNPLQKYATVVSVAPAFDTTRTPRQVCGDEAVLAQATMTAGAAGAAAPTPAPAPAPAQAEKPEPAPAAKPGETGETGETGEADTSAECVVVFDTRSEQAGFDVTYELDGAQKVVRMERDPGKRIPVEDGELILSSR